MNMIIAGAGVAADDRSVSPCTNGSKLWIFFYLDPPTLVIRKMPVEIIHFMQGDIVDVFFYIINREKVAAYIEMKTAISEAGVVFYGDKRNLDFGIGKLENCFLYWQKLNKRLHTVKNTCLISIN